jgi:hypothetical protein
MPHTLRSLFPPAICAILMPASLIAQLRRDPLIRVPKETRVEKRSCRVPRFLCRERRGLSLLSLTAVFLFAALTTIDSAVAEGIHPALSTRQCTNQSVTDILLPTSWLPPIACDSMSQVLVFMHRLGGWSGIGLDTLRVCQFNSDGMSIGEDMIVKSTFGIGPRDIAPRPSGEILICWGEGLLIRAAAFGPERTMLFQPVYVVPDPYDGSASVSGGRIAFDDAGNFVVGCNYLNSNKGIFESWLQRFNNSGNSIGSISRIPSNAKSAVAMAPDGSHAIAWNGSDFHIYVRRFSPDGNELGSSILVDTVAFVSSYHQLWMSMDQQGNIALVWAAHYPQRENMDIYLQRIDKNGMMSGPPSMVNDDTSAASHGDPGMSFTRQGALVIAWRDFRAKRKQCDIYCQRYNPDGTRFGDNLLVGREVTAVGRLSGPINVATDGNIVACTWPDSMQRVHLTIFPWQQDVVASIDPRSVPITPDYYELQQNYPNPFNPSTTIRYGLPNRTHVLLTVYNTLGQLVAQLVDGEMERGYHEARFDGAGLSSGVYFYRMQAGSYEETRKFLLIR